MRASISQGDRALDLLKTRGMLRLRDFMATGIGPETLSRLTREGVVVRPARGLYQLPDGNVDARHSLAEASALVPKGVICLISALQYHELTLQMPATIWMAIDRSAWLPTIAAPRIRFVRFSAKQMTEGVARHMIDGVNVTVTSPARTVVDCFRYRGKVGMDVALEGLREGLRGRCFKADDLWRIATTMRAWTVMRPYVEALVSDGR